MAEKKNEISFSQNSRLASLRTSSTGPAGWRQAGAKKTSTTEPLLVYLSYCALGYNVSFTIHVITCGRCIYKAHKQGGPETIA